MTDIHSHLAWGIDDGIQNKEDAIKALKTAKAHGTNIIASTPHFIPGRSDVEIIAARQEELRELAKNYGIEIHNGAELFMNRASVEAIANGFLRPYENTNYQLCEYDVRRDLHDIEYFDDPLYEMQVRNIVPVIAHVERYFKNGLDLEIVQDWFDKGFVIQVNRTSLTGEHGKIMQKNANKLIQAGLAHIVASDAHTPETGRAPILDDAWNLIANQYGEETADLLCSENPTRVVSGQRPKRLKAKKKKKRILFFFNH